MREQGVMRGVRLSLGRGVTLCMLGLGVLPAMAWDGDYEIDWEQVQQGVDWLNDQLPDDWSLAVPEPEEWQALWASLAGALESVDVLDLARIQPAAEQALAYMRSYPEASPYADWLAQRMDYLEMARDQLARYVETPSEPARSIAPPPRPVRPAVVAEAPRVRRETRAEVNWKRKVAGRPAPKGAATWVPRLKPIFEEEGVPPEWVWLAEVESSFNPSARSPVGALGLYQFMPATAERFGLKLKPTDERLTPEKSARAAAQYLRILHGRFGSWPLSLAAYNAGEGRVGRLLKQHQGQSFEDIVDYLPSETQLYVPKVLAIVSEREGVDARRLPGPGDRR